MLTGAKMQELKFMRGEINLKQRSRANHNTTVSNVDQCLTDGSVMTAKKDRVFSTFYLFQKQIIIVTPDGVGMRDVYANDCR